MGFYAELISYVVSLLTSAFDITSDIINSFDLMGFNASKTIFEAIIGPTNTNKQFEVHQGWGIVGISAVFIPGIIVLPVIMYYLITREKRIEALIALILLPMYPIALILMQIVNIIVYYKYKNKNMETFVVLMIGMEAFFESFTQIVLQGYVILYGYNVTTTQIITIMASFILLAKTSICYDISVTEKELTFFEKLTHILNTLPCYITTILFRVSSFSLTIAFLRGISIIPITL